MAHNPLEHAMDHTNLELPWGRGGWILELGKIPFTDIPLTRFMVMQTIAATLVALIAIPLARHAAKNPVSRGPLMNAFEAILLFIRDNVARASIQGHDHGHDEGFGEGHEHDHGHRDAAEVEREIKVGHEADKYVPYLWTLFLFILVNNLLGLIPGGASATGNINVTGVLAVMTFGAVVVAGMRALGPATYWKRIVPTMDLPIWIKVVIWPLMFVIEFLGLFIRHFVLAVRLFANMLAGHVVLGVILGFILMVQNSSMIYIVAPASVLGVVLLSFLELLVAFLQAYIFTLLAALFIGTAVHPH